MAQQPSVRCLLSTMHWLTRERIMKQIIKKNIISVTKIKSLRWGTFIGLMVFAMAAQPDTQMYFIHNDHLNTPKIVTDSGQAVVWESSKEPFGEAEITIEFQSRFPSQYFDPESGLHYNYYRDYDPSLGRYIQSDPIGLEGGLNTYAYVGGNPLSNVDPFGLAYSPQGEHGIPRPSSDNCGCFEKFFGVGTASGATAVAAGQPTIPYPRSGVGTGSSTGATSPASKWSRKAFGKTRIPRIPTPTGAGLGVGTGSLGGAVGRTIPGIGYGVLAYQYAQLLKCLSDCESCEK